MDKHLNRTDGGRESALIQKETDRDRSSTHQLLDLSCKIVLLDSISIQKLCYNFFVMGQRLL